MSDRIHIISASAGSGKTYRLAEELKNAVTSGDARPEAIMAMTFTVKAAEELRHRTRTHLLAAGHESEAQRLTAARMGTVNAVCAQLVQEFAFELGLSPQLRVLEEGAANKALRESLSSIITEEVKAELDDLASRLDVYRSQHTYGPVGWDWQTDVERVIELVRANDVPEAALDDCARRSKEGFLELLGAPAGSGATLDRELIDALAGFIGAVEATGDDTKTTSDVLRKIRPAVRRLQQGLSIRWNEWASLTTAKSAKKTRDAMAIVNQAAARHDEHPLLRADAIRAIEMVFELARRGLARYQLYKKDHGVLDFTDQEALALQLLDRPEVQARLRERIDLVLVDEFQDTSPIQLAIFLRLASISPRSVWVGDQKQAIYAFRGTDPALMDAVIDQVLAGDEPETLEKSWRSRPGLVDLTSDLFVPPFGERGTPESRVRLTPDLGAEPPGLGPVLELALRAKNIGEDAAALAGLVGELIADESVRVRDRRTGEPRRVGPDDVAILCRRNKTAKELAAEMDEVGVESRMLQPGLLETLEARAVMAGLALWIDTRDALAAAELARMIAFPEDGDGWLQQLVDRPGAEAFEDVDVVRAIVEARRNEALSGPIDVLDRVIELVGVQDLCRRWGGAGQRLANVEALRRQAVEYVDRCAEVGVGCTPTGMVLRLMEQAESETDERGLAHDEPAVTVSTWHGAKGLEWPITVLFELDRPDPKLAAIGVHVECDRERIDLADPLADRWIRYWPYPLGYPRGGLPFRDRLTAHARTATAMERHESEELRLLYVGWTRARDRLILAARSGNVSKGTLERLVTAEHSITDPKPDDASVTWTGSEVDVVVRDGGVMEPMTIEPVTERGYAAGVPCAHPAAYRAPSELEVKGAAGEPERIGERIAISGKPEWSHLGSAIHGFLAADRVDLDRAVRRSIADRALQAWGVEGAIAPDDLLVAAERLRAWVEARWPDASWRRELPIMSRQPDGSIVRGESDLVLETDGGIVVIDHKSFPGSVAQAAEEAAGYAGQVSAYAAAVGAACTRPVHGCYVHLPISGVVIPVTGEEPSS